MTSVVLFTRPRCPLCDQARAALEGAGVAFDEVDITGDPALEAEHGMFVPVVEVSGRIVFHAGMDASELPELVAHGSA